MIDNITLAVSTDAENNNYEEYFSNVNYYSNMKELNEIIKKCKTTYISFIPNGYKITNFKALEKTNNLYYLVINYNDFDIKNSIKGKLFNTSFLKMNYIEFDEKLENYYEKNFIKKVFAKLHRDKSTIEIDVTLGEYSNCDPPLYPEEYAKELIFDTLSYIIYIQEYCPALDWDMEFKYCIYNLYKHYDDELYKNELFEYLILELFKRWEQESNFFRNIDGIEYEQYYKNISFPNFVNKFCMLVLSQGEN